MPHCVLAGAQWSASAQQHTARCPTTAEVAEAAHSTACQLHGYSMQTNHGLLKHSSLSVQRWTDAMPSNAMACLRTFTRLMRKPGMAGLTHHSFSLVQVAPSLQGCQAVS